MLKNQKAWVFFIKRHKQTTNESFEFKKRMVTMNTASDIEFLANNAVVAKDWRKRFPNNAAPTTSTTTNDEKVISIRTQINF